MESFYGGKQGISFNIVQHFDGIDIPQPDANGKYTYTGNYYAIDDSESFIIVNDNKIVKNVENQFDYRWKYHLHDGTDDFPEILAQGMVQCFDKGGATTSEVGYGEYVIIDTIVNCHNSSHIDNGKIYRRGMNYGGPLAGAEYIGQVVGPKGQSPELEIDSVYNIIGTGQAAEDYPNKGEYVINTDAEISDLVPGNPKGGDKIIYAWADIRDESGDIIGAKIGFKFPYLVVDFTARQVHPYWYTKKAQPAGGEKSDGKFIVPTNDQPFNKSWEIRVPQGVHGMDVKNIRIDATTDPSNQMFVYDEVDYSNPAPKVNQRSIAPYKVISNIDLDLDGTLTIIYTHGQGEDFNKTIKWLDKLTLSDDGYFDAYFNINRDKSTDADKRTRLNRLKWIKNAKLTTDGKLQILYNTNTKYVNVKDENNDDTIIKWIDSVDLGTDGSFVINYNNGDSYNADLSWVSNVTIDQDGTIRFFDCANNKLLEAPKFLKALTSVSVNTGLTEGDGNQKIHVTYNTGVSEDIGNPINYIIESAIVTEENAAKYNVKPYHLLVYYAAPSKRTGNITYRSEVLNKDVSGWIDLGYIRGEVGGLRIIGDLDNMSKLQKADGSWKTPQEVLGADWKDDYIGWAVTVENRQIYIYDYVKEIWYSIGEALAKPDNIMVVSDTMPGENLLEGGIWFIKETINVM